MSRRRIPLLLPLLVLAPSILFAAGESGRRPNVVLVITDDQGYGDLACHGNTEIRTPALDALHAESVRLTDFHVDPTCAPTRSALMTGRYSSRTGVWHTIMGRSIMRTGEVTLPELLSQAGYRTAMFGKWHLGDNAPSRPQDQGFQQSLIHGGGGVGQTPDFWGNDYFDDTYWRNGTPEKQEGYCTDVFFGAALDFVEEHREQPFFAYIATNAPHGPFFVDESYSAPYKAMGIPSPRAEFYAMITNIDENVARLVRRLDELDLRNDTILIFMTDNGTATGIDNRGGFNAGMRAKKGSPYEGGHRVPFFIRWPGGGIGGDPKSGHDVEQLTAHIDVLPTLAELCSVDGGRPPKIDGTSLVPLLKGKADWSPRTLVVHSQRIEHPEKWRQSAVMSERWRLVNGSELYDIAADPGQERDVAKEQADVVAELRGVYDAWWESISDRFDEYVRIDLGSERENPSRLTCHDWHTSEEIVPWNQTVVARSPESNGFWAVRVAKPGTYELALRVRPEGVEHPLPAGTARVKLGEVEANQPIEPGSSAALFRLDLPAGDAMLETWLEEPNGTSRGAYFVEVRRVD